MSQLYFSVFLKLFYIVYGFRIRNTDSINFRQYDGLDLMKEDEKREFLYGFKTIYAPEYGYMNTSDTVRRKREDSVLSEVTYKLWDNIIKDIDEALEDNRTDDLPKIRKRSNENDYVDDVFIPNQPIEKTEAEMFQIEKFPTKILHDLREQVLKALNISEPTLDKPSLKPFFSKTKLSKKNIRLLQSNLMQKYMNAKMDPCEDFYEYACGNWKNYFQIPPDRTTYDTFEMVRENLDSVIRDTLDEIEPAPLSRRFNKRYKNGIVSDLILDARPKSDSTSAIAKVKHFYMSCMNEKKINQRGTEPLLNIIQKLGGWPIINPNWSEDNFDVIWLLAQLRVLNNDVLISEWVGPDMKNSNEYILHIDQTSLGLPSREYYLDSTNIKYIKAYKSFIKDLALILGEPKNVRKDVDDIVDFEVNLAEIMTSSEERRNVSDVYLRTDLETLPLYFPQFEWRKYFRIVLGEKVNPLSPVACYCAEYLQKLIYLLSVTPKSVLQNYILWRFIRHRSSNMDRRFTDAKQRFYNVLFGREQEPPRWTFCVSQVNANMGMAVGALFVNRYFDINSRNDTIRMTEQLENAFIDTLLENPWLDNHTKEYARMKINAMDLKIGYPDFILNEDQLAERYNDIEIHPEYFFENIISILKHLTRSEQLRISSEVNRTLWSTSPAVVNAYYSRNKNQILFPAGMLQPPFYHKYFPKALNFGGIGVVIGHEITHGFDDKGRLFDHEGNLHLWWRESSIERFYEKATCLINQYSKYVLPMVNIPLDGYLTQGENIADNGGLKQAFRAYKKWVQDNKDLDESLPGMELTGEQLFFLNFAQVWCGQQRIEAAKSRMKTSVHAPGIFRVIGAISNSEDFAKAYSCPIGCPMNPQNKCQIW